MRLRHAGHAQHDPTADPATEAARRIFKECDAKLARYRAALEAGTDPALVARWTTEIQARRAEAAAHPRQTTAGHRMSQQDIRSLVEALGTIHTALAHAEPDDKAEVYHHLGLRLTYEPGTRLVRAEAHLNPHGWGYGSCPRGDSKTIPLHSCAWQVFMGSTIAVGDWRVSSGSAGTGRPCDAWL